jgi:hypothetical protein
MHRLLVENDWYETLPPNAIPDTTYEDLLDARASVLYPGFFFVPLRYRVSFEGESCMPHLALVDRAYRGWWLTLLETGLPPAAPYVNQQARILRAARYGRDFAELLADRCPGLDADAVERLTRREPPGVYVLIAHPPGPSINDAGILVGVAEVFRSSTGTPILRINGQQPTAPDERIGTCSRNSHVQPHILKLTLAVGVNATIPPRCEIEVEGSVSEWTSRPSGTDFYLIPDASVPLPVEQDIFALLRSNTGRLRLLAQNS